MDKFANIGKSVLIQSLGLQKNYIEVLEDTIDVLDYNTPSCQTCKCRALIEHFRPDTEAYEAALNSCRCCPNKTLTQKTVYKKVYHNEKNQYGYKPRLKSNAIKLFLLLHFYHPDRFGIIQDLNIDVLAKLLHCDIKTVRNNLETLQSYDYISYCKVSAHMINLCLCDYETYYLPAGKGGRGFFVLSKELLHELLSLDNLLSLRIHLRELIDIDNLNAKGPFTAISKTYKELQRTLPDYCKPCMIRDAVKNDGHIFDITFKEKSIRFEIRTLFESRKQKNDCYHQYILLLKDFMRDFNEAVACANNDNIYSNKYALFFKAASPSGTPFERFRLIQIRDFEFEDMAQLALQYSFDAVIAAYSQVYHTYIMYDRPVINLGGLLRTAIIASMKAQKSAA